MEELPEVLAFLPDLIGHGMCESFAHLRIDIPGEHYDFHRVILLAGFEKLEDLQPVDFRHSQVEEDDLRLSLADQEKRFVSVVGNNNIRLGVLRADSLFESKAEDLIVVDDHEGCLALIDELIGHVKAGPGHKILQITRPYAIMPAECGKCLTGIP